MAWHDQSNQETFRGAIDNVLKLQVEFKYKKPYGGSAKYLIEIDAYVPSNNSWRTVIRDEVAFYPEASDDTWHTEYKDYDLHLSRGPLFRFFDLTAKYKLTARIEGTGHYDSGSGTGSLGKYGEPESREFTVILEAPEIFALEAHLANIELLDRDSLVEYRRLKAERKEEHEAA